MKIVSEFKDYYDNVGAYDREKFPVYVRNTSCMNYNTKKMENVLPGEGVTTVYFCGKIYFGLVLFVKNDPKKPYFIRPSEVKTFPYEKFKNSYYFGNKASVEEIRSKVSRLLNQGHHKNLASDEVAIVAVQKAPHGPTFHWTNPCLKNFGFQRIVEPFAAYQELSMWVSNLAVHDGNCEPRGMTDELKAETKGFDKWSFRRHREDNLPKRRKDRVF